MKLRPPAVPLITIDPYFSVWSPADRLNDCATAHWTGKPQTLDGFVIVDGERFTFMGNKGDCKLAQTKLDCTALTTAYTFVCDKITLDITFFTALLPDDLYTLSRPVSFMKAVYMPADGKPHTVTLCVLASEEICINLKGETPVKAEVLETGVLNAAKIGSTEQNVLARSGDDLRIDWGYFYLASDDARVSVENIDEMTFVSLEKDMTAGHAEKIIFAYDDIKSIQYFGKNLDAFWHKDCASIENAMDESFGSFDTLLARCQEFSERLFDEAAEAGGIKYAELVSLAYRQIIAAHKLVVNQKGENLFISKECFSNGCAATVDVTYPSASMFLYYNTELLKGMLRPVFDYAASEEWCFDFAPHDVGLYPHINGQVYGKNNSVLNYDSQMPVEESGNMLILMAAISITEGNADFAKEYIPFLSKWVKYLIKYGADPENQLCTDDFAGHLAHNCNLALKAIMGIAGYSKILTMLQDENADYYMNIARSMANDWVQQAANEDGSFRLTFDRPDTYSMKYNIIWDKIWDTQLFVPCVLNSEFLSYFRHLNAYGLPLDSRKDYTKSDWYIWVASLASHKEEFEQLIQPLWDAYNVSPSRVAMTDWFSTVTSEISGFVHRSVQGGLFMRLLAEKNK